MKRLSLFKQFSEFLELVNFTNHLINHYLIMICSLKKAFTMDGGKFRK